LFDTALPLTVNEVVTWERPSLLLGTAAEGVMLASPGDLARIWPEIWPNTRAADRTLEQGVPVLPGFVPVTYQPVGRNMKSRVGYFNTTIIPDLRAWLETRLGPLAQAGPANIATKSLQGVPLRKMS
jgi:putative DNA primase/helicase